jgi:hypothetical protein
VLISLHTKEEPATTGLTALPHPPYSPDSASSDFHLFGPLKDALQGYHFVDDVETLYHEELQCFSKKFHMTGIQHLMQRWKKCIDNEEDFVEKEFQLCKGRTHDM